MAKCTLKAGAQLDILSADEMAAQVDRIVQVYRDMELARDGETVRHTGSSFKTDGTGGTSSGPYGGYGVYRVPAGYNALLTRLSVDYEGSDAASLVTCDVRICANQNTPSALRSIANALPNVFDASKSHAPLFVAGELVVVSITGGPASTTMYVSLQVNLTKRLAIGSDTLT